MKNYCPEIYKGLSIDRWNDEHIQVAPCCQAHPTIIPTQGFDFRKNNYLKTLRDKFDRGEKPKECKRCWEDEDVGRQSRRQSMQQFNNDSNSPESNELLSSHIDDDKEDDLEIPAFLRRQKN